MLIVTMADGSTISLPDARGYRISRSNGTLTVWGRRLATIAAWPQGTWRAITQPATASLGRG